MWHTASINVSLPEYFAGWVMFLILNISFFSCSTVCDTKQIMISERDGEASLEYAVPLKSYEFKFQRHHQSIKLCVTLRLLQVSTHWFLGFMVHIIISKKILIISMCNLVSLTSLYSGNVSTGLWLCNCIRNVQLKYRIQHTILQTLWRSWWTSCWVCINRYGTIYIRFSSSY